MPKVLENIQIGFTACRIGMRKCWQWLRCYRPVNIVRDQYQIICLGISGAGKSTALAVLVGESAENIEPTTGFNIKTLPLKDTVIDIKELGGSESVRPFWNRYFQGQHGILFVIDSSADDVKMKNAIESLQSVVSDISLKSVPCVILATHQDAEGARSQQQVEQLLQSVLHGRRWKVQLCGFQDRNSIHQGFETLIDLMTGIG